MLHINCFSKTIHNYNNFMLICSIGKIIVSIDSYPSGKRFCSIFYMSCRFKYSVCSLSKIEKKRISTFLVSSLECDGLHLERKRVCQDLDTPLGTLQVLIQSLCPRQNTLSPQFSHSQTGQQMNSVWPFWYIPLRNKHVHSSQYVALSSLFG